MEWKKKSERKGLQRQMLNDNAEISARAEEK